MLANRLRAARITGEFDPLSLSPLVFYDPLDISTLWQDTGRTNPITADGQRVRCIDDKSGNGYHANGGNGMIYSSSGWIKSPSSSDALLANVPAQIYPFFMIGACGRNSSTAASGSFFVSNKSGNNDTAGIYFNDGSVARALVTTGLVSAVSNSDQKAILSLAARSGDQSLYCNTVKGNSLNTPDQPNLTRLSISALDRSSTVFHFGENGGFLLFDYDIGDSNRLLCEQWAANRYGVTL